MAGGGSSGGGGGGGRDWEKEWRERKWGPEDGEVVVDRGEDNGIDSRGEVQEWEEDGTRWRYWWGVLEYLQVLA